MNLQIRRTLPGHDPYTPTKRPPIYSIFSGENTAFNHSRASRKIERDETTADTTCCESHRAPSSLLRCTFARTGPITSRARTARAHAVSDQLPRIATKSDDGQDPLSSTVKSTPSSRLRREQYGERREPYIYLIKLARKAGSVRVISRSQTVTIIMTRKKHDRNALDPPSKSMIASSVDRHPMTRLV